MPQAENEKEQDDALRRFIDRLENWPEDAPPTPAELRILRRDIRLTQDDRDKLEILAENHLTRARSSQQAGAYDQAAAELARAAQLRPLDSRPRVELAGIYLQRSLERGYGRTDRTKAIRLAKKALELNPSDLEAKEFLREYRRMNADFRTARYRRYLWPVVLLVLLIAAAAWWQREWIYARWSPNFPTDSGSVQLPPREPLSAGESRDVPANIAGTEDGFFTSEITVSQVGSKNDGSYVYLQGRLRSETRVIDGLELLVRGLNDQGETVFALPYSVLENGSPLLRPGDSKALSLFRWLPESEKDVESLEIRTLESSLLQETHAPNTAEGEIVWDVPRPEGANLKSEIRDLEILEAYDSQVVLMELALENTGIKDLNEITATVSLGSEWAPLRLRAVGTDQAALAKSEKRVWSLAMGLPLDADVHGRPVTIRIVQAGLD